MPSPIRLRRPPQLIAVAVALLLLVACATVPPSPSETLASFEIVLPEIITFGLPFELTVRAVGSGGTVPLGEFSGPVDVVSDRGDLSAGVVELSDGVVTLEATLHAEAGAVTLDATASGVSGEGTATVAFLAALPGDPGDPVAEAIPDIDFEPAFATYRDGHPVLTGSYATDTLGLSFQLDATVAEANAVLASFGAEIVGGIPGEVGSYAGLLIVRAGTETHQGMEDLLARLESESVVEIAVQDALMQEEAVPDSNRGTPGAWSWDLPPSGGNWGMEFIRAPQMWNLNPAIDKALANNETSRVLTAIYDTGFCPHDDIRYLVHDSNICQSHGTAVAGIIGATFGNGVGIDGLNPYADLLVFARKNISKFDFFDALEFDALELIVENHPLVRVINKSMGGNYNPSSATSVSRLEKEAKQLMDYLNSLGPSAPFIVDSAGNDGIDARFNGPPGYAALELNQPGIVMVEAITETGALRSNSNFGGHLSAPGTDILSTDGSNDYTDINDTSAAAPHVTGLVGYLLVLDPSLTNAELKQLLLENTQTTTSATPAIDAFATALDIDSVQGNSRVLFMLLDIDDGTPDGNQRLVIGTDASTLDVDGDGVADGALDDPETLRFRPDTLGEEDADGDGGSGDGLIDMADFRRWRDWYLQANASSPGIGAVDLDGSANHPKKDPNGNGLPNEGAAESIYPRGDFNGDGRLSLDADSFVPGVVSDIATDLQVLARLFSDPHYAASQLPGLVESADITVWPKNCFGLEVDGVAVDQVVSSVRLRGSEVGDPIEQRSHAAIGEREIYTVALPNAFTVRVEAFGGSESLARFERDYVGLALGEDVLFDACDPRPTLSSVTGSRSSLSAIEGPDEVFTEVEFTLAFEDPGKNLATIVPRFTLGATVIEPPPLAVDDDAVEGFQGAASGGGTVLFDLLVFCSEAGDNPMTAHFQLIDAFGQLSEEQTFDLEVDYGDCGTDVRDADSTGLRLQSRP